MAWWNHLVNWGPPPRVKPRTVGVMQQPSRITERPPDPAPLLLTKAMMLKPTAAQWKRANEIFEHPRGCRCSTCRLVAEMAVMIKNHDARGAQ